MASDATVVLGGWLPDDHNGRRTGRPDVLLRVEGGWIPVDVKHHGMATAAPGCTERQSSLEDLWPTAGIEIADAGLSGNALGDALQLAHYWRLLEACGLAAGHPLGGIIGSDGGVWWIDLAEARWKRRSISALDLYDREFRLRLAVIERQIKRNARPDLPPLVIPLRKSECPSCGWRQVCGLLLAEGDDVSLLPGAPWPNALRLIRRGIATRSLLAALDWDTAWLMHGDAPGATQVGAAEILVAAEGVDASTDLVGLLGRGKRTRLARLDALGMATVDDLGRLDWRTASLSGVKVGYLPGLIDQARAAVSGRVFRARGLERIQVPRADVEVDVDMENCDASVYLWGTWSCGPDGMPGGYQPFVDWTPLDGNVEAQLFARFWAWLMQLRDSTVGSGDTFAAYCYSSAENTQMRRIAAGSEVGPSLDEVDCFIASPEWVDLLTVMRGQLVTGGSLGLKQVAPLAGFHWRDEDPGGDQSMVWYERAVNNSEAEVRGENRARLLAYNEDDVKATEAVREWLEGSDFEPITEWTV
jgi:predicted RecB family nuclease